MLLTWNNAEEKAKGIKIKFLDNKAWNEYRYPRSKDGYLYYEIEKSLFFFLHLIINENDGNRELRKMYFSGLQCHTDGRCGEYIWKYIKDNMI